MIFYASLFSSYLEIDDSAGNFTYGPLENNKDEEECEK